MTDDVTKAIARMRDQMANGDPDWWRDEELILRHIDGEPARLAAAREEQREACIAIVSRWVGGIVPGLNAVGELRATPLAATPLADEIAALRAEVVSLRAHQAAIEAVLEPSSNIETTLGGRVKALRARVAYLEGELHETIGENADLVVRAERAEAERDALRAQLLSERERLERWLTAPDGKQYERGTVQAVFDECDALRAQQVDLLDAMDKSKP